MMMNMSAIPANIPIIAGSMYRSGSRDSCCAAKVSENKILLKDYLVIARNLAAFVKNLKHFRTNFQVS